ncbi:hypothetical protein, partial [Actinotalea sp.]|uniref:hypothetical protein n=1 Tax=Actinotalea sp. TaxID=1872145 RepID=UPI0035612C31
IRGAHTADCDPQATPCKGCAPRSADHGTLCEWCYGRLTTDLAAAPGVVHHLRELGRPFASAAPPSDLRHYRDPAEGDIRPAEWDAADELHAMLASWALTILEEHPDGASMAGPEEVGAWHTRYGTTVGVHEAKATARLARWLIDRIEWAAGQEWAAEMRREVGEVLATTTARWPVVETRSRTVAGVSCVRCSRESLVYTPTTFYRASPEIRCSHPECGRLYTEDEFDGTIGRLAIKRGYVA